MVIRNKDGLVTKHYQFHQFFRLALHSADAKAIRHFQAEYSGFEVPPSSPVDLDVTVGKFSLEPNGDVSTFGKYRLSADWIYAAERYKVARWQFAIYGLAEPTTYLFFHGGMFTLDFLQGFLIEQIMRYKICQKGLLLIHSGCVARNGVSVLFPGLGHAGKTALALWQVLAGQRFQADDYTFLSARGETYSYPRRLHISDHMYAACPAAMQHLSPKHRLSIKTKKLIYYLSLKYGDLSESLQLTELVPKAEIEEVARLKAVLLLTSSTRTELQEPHPLPKDELVKRVMAINRLEGAHFYNVLLGQYYTSNTRSPSAWWESERDILQQALADVSSYEMLVPRQASNPEAVLEKTARIVDTLLV
jgi:hypothetical protein